jgi:hypothetical protein
MQSLELARTPRDARVEETKVFARVSGICMLHGIFEIGASVDAFNHFLRPLLVEHGDRLGEVDDFETNGKCTVAGGMGKQFVCACVRVRASEQET